MHALHAAGDALVAVALAGTLFFSVPLGEARSRVALYLVLTMLPFSLLVPVAGPLLDRFPHGRRTVLAVTTGGRGLLTWVMAGVLTGLALYPLALIVLVFRSASPSPRCCRCSRSCWLGNSRCGRDDGRPFTRTAVADPARAPASSP